MRKRMFSLSLVMLAVVFLAAGLGANALAAEKKEITVGFSAFAPSLDPQVQFAMPSYSMCRFMFDPLVYFDWNMELKPWLAEKWEQIDDNTWKFYLKKGVKFHNGEPFNAQAVKYTMERYLDPKLKTPQKKMYSFTKSVEVVDDYTVLVKTSRPMRPLLNFWAIQGVVPPKAGADYEK
ncbi:MAG: ABC transporter substrate-binding protein, partial [Deltaproteobacteria bacterium]|nr:ABC transporter substrate-binding protein [Deltaproteobacteria bacterium]